MITKEDGIELLNRELINTQVDSNQTIFHAIVYAEMAMSMEEPWPWSDSDFEKRRKTYKFDENVQEILLRTEIDGYTAQKIECNGSGYFRCQLTNDGGGVIHVGSTFKKALHICKSTLQKTMIYRNLDIYSSNID